MLVFVGSKRHVTEFACGTQFHDRFASRHSNTDWTRQEYGTLTLMIQRQISDGCLILTALRQCAAIDIDMMGGAKNKNPLAGESMWYEVDGKSRTREDAYIPAVSMLL
jgi:hypothetical protein